MRAYVTDKIIYYCNRSVGRSTPLSEDTLYYYELTFVLNGSLVYYVNGKKVIVETGDSIFLRPNDIRSREQSKTPVHYVSFNFFADFADSFPFEQICKKCVNEDIKRLISVYHPNHLSDKFHDKEKCQNILNYILLELYDMQRLKCKNEHIMKMIKFIDEHITERLSLKDIAEYFHLSKEYTSYIFKRETGKQLVSYINEQKALLAKKIIQNEEMTLTELSYYLGFENYDYFSKIFKKYVGVSPSKFKKNNSLVR